MLLLCVTVLRRVLFIKIYGSGHCSLACICLTFLMMFCFERIFSFLFLEYSFLLYIFYHLCYIINFWKWLCVHKIFQSISTIFISFLNSYFNISNKKNCVTFLFSNAIITKLNLQMWLTPVNSHGNDPWCGFCPYIFFFFRYKKLYQNYCFWLARNCFFLFVCFASVIVSHWFCI